MDKFARSIFVITSHRLEFKYLTPKAASKTNWSIKSEEHDEEASSCQKAPKM